MKNRLQRFVRSISSTVIAALLMPTWCALPQAFAAPTDIATAPMFVSVTSSVEVKPNILFMIDDSGSMSWDYMPDTASNFQGAYGGASSQCNGVYYNPAITYAPPLYADGTSYANSTFASAKVNGYSGTTATDLSSAFKSYSGDTAQAAYYYKYSGTQTTERQKNYYDTNSVFYKECNSNIGSTTAVDGTNPVNTLFTKVTVSSTSGPGATDERVNFANWYTYYRTRMLMMKTALGRAVSTIDDHFRVGFATLNNNNSPALLNISDFNATQKSNFYTKLYGTTTGNSTPLREALANAGRWYAGKLTSLNGTTLTDPVQYACQQNYVILSTDGFWNGTDSNVKKLDGTTVMDNQDGNLPRPYNDGGSQQLTIVVPYTSTQTQALTTTEAVTTKVWTRSVTTYGADCSIAAYTPPNRYTNGPVSDSTNKRRLGVGNNKNSLTNKRCISIGASANNNSNNAWFCVSKDNSSDPELKGVNVTDVDGIKWYLVSSLAGNTNPGGCVGESSIENGLSNAVYACPEIKGVSRTYVTTTPQQQTETITVAGVARTDLYAATQTTTQLINNGLAGAVGSLSPASPSFVFQQTLSSVAVGTSSDVFSAWSNGTPSPNNVCMDNSSRPTAGTTTATVSSSVSSGGTTTTTVLATSGLTTGSPQTTTVTVSGTSNTLADVAAYYYNTNLRTQALGNCTGPVIAPATTATDLCLANKVPTYGQDSATWQHMTTFTLGLGTRGRMVFSPTYLTDTSGDYFDVKNGSLTAQTSYCTWRDTLTTSSSRCNWPVPGSDKPENIDDMWHAAINGRGAYFAATDPVSLQAGLEGMTKAIKQVPKPGTAASSATSNPQITSSNNFQFSTYFLSLEWSGELIRQTISLADGSVPTYDAMAGYVTGTNNTNQGRYDWSAQQKLDLRDWTTRRIYTKGSSGLVDFNWTNVKANSYQSYFLTPHISTSPPQYPIPLLGLSQFCTTGTNCLSSTAQNNSSTAASGASGEALVNYLRGDTSNSEGVQAPSTFKGVDDPTKFYRYRRHVLGDFISAQPQFVGAPSKRISDAGYTDYKTAKAGRTPVVLAAANDGMLHAFNVSTGEEEWAYIPSYVLPRLYTLADKLYADRHQYFVEGTPVVADICPSAPCTGAQWKTIVVGGLNQGGTGYYALDITDTSNPVLLWEFTHDNMGYSFGRPQIAKLDDGRWVVLLTSGHNNCPRSSGAGCTKNGVGNGLGYLYVLDAATGTQIASTPLTTNVGSTSTPSGLGQVVAMVDANLVIQRAYGGDLQGNLWRFTVGSTAAMNTVQKVAQFLDDQGNPQPITERPLVSTFQGTPVVLVGTGRYLGVGDVTVSQLQSFYGLKDTVTTTPFTSIRSSTDFIQKTAVNGTCPNGVSVSVCQPGSSVRTVTQNTGNATDSLVNKSGWYLDFPSGEISFTDASLITGVVAFSTSAPKPSTAQVCGEAGASDPASYSYMISFINGGDPNASVTGGVVGTYLGQGLATSSLFKYISAQDNSTATGGAGHSVFRFEYRLSDGSIKAIECATCHQDQTTQNVGPDSRISWRELSSD